MQATPPIKSQSSQGWQSYNLDHIAQELVITHRGSDVLSESHKMRLACPYGLERFWGEHLRFEGSKNSKDRAKAEYWKAVWKAFAGILASAEITLPDGDCQVRLNNQENIKATAKDIWNMDAADQRVALAVLIQLCDSLVWWTQRYKLDKDKPLSSED